MPSTQVTSTYDICTLCSKPIMPGSEKIKVKLSLTGNAVGLVHLPQCPVHPKVINHFAGPYDYLSNFYPAQVTMEGETYPTVEHAYQAAKTLNLVHRAAIAADPSPARAKRAGRALELRPNWEQSKVGVMHGLVRQKFLQDSLMTASLVTTGHAHIEEGNYWGDTFWGVCDGVGRNELGKILMRVRDELREKMEVTRND